MVCCIWPSDVLIIFLLSSSMQFSTFKYPRYLQIIGLYLIKVLIIVVSCIPLILPSFLNMILPHTNMVKLIVGNIILLSILLILVITIYYVSIRLIYGYNAYLDKGLNPICSNENFLSCNQRKCITDIRPIFIASINTAGQLCRTTYWFDLDNSIIFLNLYNNL